MLTTKTCERVLSMVQMHRIGVLHRGPTMHWTCRWNEAGRVSTIHYRMEQAPQDGSLAFRLRYRVLPEADEPESLLDYTVAVRTSPSFRGKTWYWFVCPLVVDGQPCRRRARNLHFLPWSPYFGCRHCRETMERSLPPAKRLVFRQTLAALPEEGEGETAGESGSDYFELLGVGPQASSREIRLAFTTRIKEYHPDRVAHLGAKLQQAAEEEARRIYLAYEALKDPESRLDYLRRLGKA